MHFEYFECKVAQYHFPKITVGSGRNARSILSSPSIHCIALIILCRQHIVTLFSHVVHVACISHICGMSHKHRQIVTAVI